LNEKESRCAVVVPCLSAADKLVFVHIVPPLVNFVAERAFLAGVKEAYDGEIVLGEDGMQFDLDSR